MTKRKIRGPLYSGPVLDAAARLNPSTRRGWRDRGFFETDSDEYTFGDVLNGAARAALLRFGISERDTARILTKAIVQDMLERVDAHERPTYLIVCPLPDPAAPGPVAERLVAGKTAAYAAGGGTFCVATGLSPEEVAAHVTGGALYAFFMDTSAMIRGILQVLEDSKQGVDP